MAKARNGSRVYIFDTTLRDGEQCPGASMNLAEKIEVAHQLARLKVDVIEAGFPVASPGDFEAVRSVAEQVRGPRICGLARCLDADIERCAEAVAPAGDRARIHVFLATSAIHRKFKLRKAKTEILRQAVAGVRSALRFVDDVEFSPEDASRTEPDFLADVVRAVLDAGAATINIPDTVGCALPSRFGALIAGLFDRVPGLDRRIVNVHCHNDLGLAVANSIAAIEAGARGVECTINGLGERAGNCALEELVMALRTRADALGVRTGVNPREIYRTSRMVSRVTGMVVQRNKAVVGANAFAHEAGIHQDGLLKRRETYEILSPEDIGVPGSELVLGKHSGRHALRAHLDRMGLRLAGADFEALYQRFIELADKKKTVYDDDLFALAQDRIQDAPAFYALDYLHVSSGSHAVATATVRLRKGGRVIQDAACGSGPVDAALKSVDRISGTPGRLLDYTLQAVTQGQDAIGEVSLRAAFGNGSPTSAKASSTDIVEASVKAYVNALNRHLTASKQKRGGRRKAAGPNP